MAMPPRSLGLASARKKRPVCTSPRPLQRKKFDAQEEELSEPDLDLEYEVLSDTTPATSARTSFNGGISNRLTFSSCESGQTSSSHCHHVSWNSLSIAARNTFGNVEDYSPAPPLSFNYGPTPSFKQGTVVVAGPGSIFKNRVTSPESTDDESCIDMKNDRGDVPLSFRKFRSDPLEAPNCNRSLLRKEIARMKSPEGKTDLILGNKASPRKLQMLPPLVAPVAKSDLTAQLTQVRGDVEVGIEILENDKDPQTTVGQFTLVEEQKFEKPTLPPPKENSDHSLERKPFRLRRYSKGNPDQQAAVQNAMNMVNANKTTEDDSQ